jgi:hypothetical protein
MGLLSGVDDFTGWALLQNNGAAIQTAYAATTPSASDVAYLKSVLPTLKTPAALLDNYRALSIVTSAFGLGSEVNQTAILGKLMTQDPTSSASLAQQLSDNRYLQFAQAMSTYQPNTVFTSASIASLTAAYALSAPGGPATSAQVQAFQAIAPDLQTAADVAANSTAATFIATAYGVPALANQPSVLTNLLTQDPTASNSVAQQSGNAGYLALATALSTFSSTQAATQAGVAAPAVLSTAAIATVTAAYKTAAENQAPPGGGLSIAAQTALFKLTASGLTTPASVVANPTAAAYIATAYGVPALATQPSVLTNLLTQDPTASTSVAQQSGNKGYLALATALSTFKPLYSSTAAGITAITTGYQQNSFQTAVGADNPALQEAMYFKQTAGGATTVTQLMADPALLNVVRVAEGLPTAFGNLEFSQQVSILTSRVDMKQFATPAGVSAYITKYLAMDQVNGTASGTGSSDPLMALFGNGSSSSDGSSTDSTTSLVTAKSLNLLL